MQSILKVCPKHGQYISYYFELKYGNVKGWSSCEKCVDEYDSDIKKCPGYKDSEAARNANFLHCGAGKRDMDKAGYDKFIQKTDEQFVINNITRSLFLKMQEGLSPVTLFMRGNPGTGKTYFALSMLKDWCSTRLPDYVEPYMDFNNDGFLVEKHRTYELVRYQWGKYMNSDELVDIMNNRRSYITNMTKQEALKYYIEDVPLLVIDEIGRSISNPKSEHDMLFKVVSGRISNGLSTIMCSNLDEDQTEKLLGGALISRISEFGTILAFTEKIPDMRLT